MKIWVERQVGLLRDSPGARKFDGTAHEFIDCTDRPAPAVVAGRPVHIVIEHDGSRDPMTSPAKPDYRVPPMNEIVDLPWNGLNVVSTFAGCGGSSTGYRMAGFRVLWASEFVDAARETYAANARPETIVDGRDIREVTAAEILAATGLGVGDLDVLDGSPPCASFSTAGKREAGWGVTKKYSDKAQRSDDLFFEFARLVGGLKPKVFVAENVSGLVKGTAKGYFLEILAALKAEGYRVSARLLDAQWLGVPQARQRLIFIGVREDLAFQPAHPKPLAYRYSIRDALPWITAVGRVPGGDYDKKGRDRVWGSADEPAPTIITTQDRVPLVKAALVLGGGNAKPNKPGNSFPRNKQVGLDEPCPTIMAAPEIIGSAPHELVMEGRRIMPKDTVPENVGASLEGYAIGEEWDKVGPGGQSEKYFQLVRPRADAPCPTLTAAGGGAGGIGVAGSTAGVTHPTEKRKFSIAELRRIGGFPDDFILTGSYAQQWERIGRAVPPVMMSHIAAVIRDQLLASR